MKVNWNLVVDVVVALVGVYVLMNGIWMKRIVYLLLLVVVVLAGCKSSKHMGKSTIIILVAEWR